MADLSGLDGFAVRFFMRGEGFTRLEMKSEGSRFRFSVKRQFLQGRRDRQDGLIRLPGLAGIIEVMDDGII